MVSSLKVPPQGCYRLLFNSASYTLNIFLTDKGRKIRILVSTYAEEML